MLKISHLALNNNHLPIYCFIIVFLPIFILHMVFCFFHHDLVHLVAIVLKKSFNFIFDFEITRFCKITMTKFWKLTSFGVTLISKLLLCSHIRDRKPCKICTFSILHVIGTYLFWKQQLNAKHNNIKPDNCCHMDMWCLVVITRCNSFIVRYKCGRECHRGFGCTKE